jgi:hypothetical protein
VDRLRVGRLLVDRAAQPVELVQDQLGEALDLLRGGLDVPAAQEARLLPLGRAVGDGREVALERLGVALDQDAAELAEGGLVVRVVGGIG